ncbi:RNA ligase RtcB family protein [Kineosporia rhizophila]|uniref:RNA ligase RtcB family protein n=1 Tax=Kineosporia TaxID=49184 RepID=UPI001E30C45A|nr:RNA ligase RtcB family protein [Kineosporia sp. NBRC 101677]MCE0538213.1 RNA ligase RtcB family protein [Kineosporia rhizophila]GLY15051.1 RNA ligase RtcB family protein [Kineosporia sp. NBRC 101677]
MPVSIPDQATVTVFASPRSWIETPALDQCHQVAGLPGMLHVAGMPDLHPGKGAPIGAAMSSTVLYPHLVGGDIGCGIAVFPVHVRKLAPERLARRFPDLDQSVEPPPEALEEIRTMDALGHLDRLEGFGTVGRGNHFVELARVDRIQAPDHAARLGLEPRDLVLIVHSGSRGLGERILRSHTDEHGAGPAASPEQYLAAHDAAVRWAVLNRRTIATRVADAIGARLDEPVVDVCHNLVELRDGSYLHRKGAAPGDGGDVLVAGTRGTPSALVATHSPAEANFSVAHGAGRKMSRSDALRRNQAKHTVAELRRTAVGSIVVCGDRQLLFEEAPAAYKRIEQVIDDLTTHHLATPVATTVPVITYKTQDPAQRPRR